MSRARSSLNNPYSAGVDMRRQNLKSKVDPRTVKIKYP